MKGPEPGAPAGGTEPPERVRLVTVAREFGSGGTDLARALATRLGWRLLEDREIVRRVAHRLGVPEREVEARDEHVTSLAERVGASLAGAFPEVVLPPEGPAVDPEAVKEAVVEVMVKAAETDLPAVLVGHGGMCLLGDRPDAVHVRVVARMDHRVREAVGRLGVDPDAAREEIEARDADRRAWIRRWFGQDWEDPTLYHLVLNRGEVDAIRGAAVVAALVLP